ncbi:LytR/AlgR family response regulator transcription factor [Robiginitalea marina]|uniref:LytTR family DNA-binding domain-containing protein n=1 Tax=Robiginitalea marina TaxID=2954105 RepID=A0ABT1AYU3_9FLAO|nr:LytTR family DNA-binding domain-containing protein [Robiginitalea marina]MCO5725206.1 LytTR family DNA-binding domain-containing protein [Robiginitalea marina]
MKKIAAFIVEDSRLARKEMRELLRAHPEIEVVGEAETVDQAFAAIKALKPELLFLDIHMPEKTGFDLLEMLDEVPTTIFTTAYDEFAIKAFEYNTLDYLLKPISPSRLAHALGKVEARRADRSQVSRDTRLNGDSQIFIRDGERCWLVSIGDIYLFETVGNYTRVFFETEQPLLYKSLNQIEEKLPETSFFRANRQQIVNIGYVREVIPWFNGKLKLRLPNMAEVEVSRRQSTEFRNRMSL